MGKDPETAKAGMGVIDKIRNETSANWWIGQSDDINMSSITRLLAERMGKVSPSTSAPIHMGHP